MSQFISGVLRSSYLLQTALSAKICSFITQAIQQISKAKVDYLSYVDKKNQLDVIFVFFMYLLIVAQHVSCNHVPIIRS